MSTFDKVMCKFVSMSLNNSIDGSVWQVMDQLGDLVIIYATRRLLSTFGPFAIFVTDSAVIANMPQYQDSIGTCLL